MSYFTFSFFPILMPCPCLSRLWFSSMTSDPGYSPLQLWIRLIPVPPIAFPVFLLLSKVWFPLCHFLQYFSSPILLMWPYHRSYCFFKAFTMSSLCNLSWTSEFIRLWQTTFTTLLGCRFSSQICLVFLPHPLSGSAPNVTVGRIATPWTLIFVLLLISLIFMTPLYLQYARLPDWILRSVSMLLSFQLFIMTSKYLKLITASNFFDFNYSLLHWNRTWNFNEFIKI